MSLHNTRSRAGKVPETFESNPKKILKLEKPFNLAKLPNLVLCQIIQVMTLFEQFLLSMCSKKTFQTIRSSRIGNSEIWMSNPTYSSIAFHVKSGKKEEKIMMIERDDEHSAFSNMKNFMKLDPSTTGQFLLCRPIDESIESIMEMHNNLCDLFKAPKEVYIEMICPDIEFLPENCVKRSVVKEEKTGLLSSSKQYFDSHPNQDFVHFHIKWGASDLQKAGDNINDTKNMLISNSGCSCSHISMAFRGEHVLFIDANIHVFYLKIFFKKWLKTENNVLKSMILKFHPDCVLKKEDVLKNLEYGKWDPTKRDRHYPYKSIVSEYHEFPKEAFDCADGMDIIRNDGKMATIKMTKDYFMFLVWE